MIAMAKATGNAKGQPRKSKAEKAKTGSINSTREKEYAQPGMTIIPLEKYPEAPAGLGDEGKFLWDVVVRELKDQRVISAIDLFNLRAMCIEWEAYLKLRAEQANGSSYYEIKGEDGKAKSFQPHPLHYNATNHLREFNRIANDFGLSPASRLRMGINTQDSTKSKAASLLKKAV